MACLQQCAPHNSSVNVRHRLVASRRRAAEAEAYRTKEDGRQHKERANSSLNNAKWVMKLSSNTGSDHDIESRNRHNLHFRYHQNSRSATTKSGQEREKRRARIGCFSKRGKGRPMGLLPAFADWKGLFHP